MAHTGTHLAARDASAPSQAPTISFAADDAVRCAVIVPLSKGRAFELFRHDIYYWWPRERTWAGAALTDLFLEGRRGGMMWERGPDGLRLDCARVMRWLPPDRLVLRWHVGPGLVPQPDTSKTSEVDFQFEALDGAHARVALEHRGFGNHGQGASAYHAFMGAPEGWPHILKRFAEHCEMAENVRRFRAEIEN
jgi:hypothetical protein